MLILQISRKKSEKMSDNRTISCPRSHRAVGLVLIELVVVFVIIGLLLSLVAIDPVARIQQARSSEDVFRLAHTLRMAAENAVMQGKKFAVVIDITDGYYEVYKLDIDDSFYDEQDDREESDELDELDESDELDELDELDEPFVKPGYLKDNYIEQIDFEDGSYQLSGEFVLYATAQGWDQSVVFRLINDQTEQQRFLRCDRYTTNVKSSRKPIELLEPLEKLTM